jgi:hypothetical protein
MEQVDQLIGAGNIGAARNLLRSLDDPRAVKALEKLNRKYPPETAAAPLPPLKPKSPPATAPARVELPPALRQDEMEEIKEAIREKRYDDAEALLVLSDHPDAEKLRDRLTAIRGGGGGGKVKHVHGGPEKDFTNRLVICIVLLFFAFVPGLIALEIFVGEARQFPDAPGAKGLIRTRRIVMGLMLVGVVLFVLCGLMMVMVNQVSENAYATVMAR